MTGRERVRKAIAFEAPDKAPLQYYYSPVGYYEHGDKLNSLYRTLPGDFGPHIDVPIPVIKPSERDADGRYHYFYTDEWGTVWEKRIYGITGIPHGYPLDDITKLSAGYSFPPIRELSEAETAEERRKTCAHQLNWYAMRGTGSLLERLRQLRRDEDVFCDLAEGTPEISLMADEIMLRCAANVAQAIAVGADAISFGDDYGAERSLLMSPELWRSFFKPRLARLFAPAAAAGLSIVFHSCGYIMPILEDLREIGVSAIWPQLPAYNMRELASHCRRLGLAVAIHTDRANTMTFGTPEQVRELVKREFETFDMMSGGSWFYVEADNGFPFENIEALIETIAEWR